MKVQLHEEKTFAAKFGERVLHGLLREQWHGLDRLIDANGRDLILNNGKVVKGHPDLLRELGAISTPPAGFIRVPGGTLKLANGAVHIVPDFYVAQRKASKGDDGKIVIDAGRKPWVNLTFAEMKAAAAAAGQNLMTGSQHLVLALDIAEQDINWTGGKVGEGEIYRGLHRGTVSGPVDGNYTSHHANERRWHQLSTGERIEDFSGLVFEALIDDLYGDDDGLLTEESFASGSPYITAPPFPSCEKGTGYHPSAGADWSGGALVRGGRWLSDDRAGVFRLYYWYPDRRCGFVGFRCTLPAEPLVPGL